jgi:phospholipid/cholesterol/gamma-HCH transport system substrate-binding protein
MDRLRLSVDAWDFGAKDDRELHLSAGLAVGIYKGIYLSAGWDDLLNSRTDNAYVGIGIRFIDEDFKYISSKLPLPSMK